MKMAFSIIILALAALAAAAPAQKGRSLPRFPVDRSLYEKLAHYAGYPLLSTTGICEHPSIPGVLYQFVESKETDTQISIWKVDSDKEFIVAIPGTSGVQDMLTDIETFLLPYRVDNVDCFSCFVHAGFQAAWLSVMKDVQRILTNLLDKYPDFTVTLSGHSLGGGLTAVAFPSLRNGPYNVTKAYTFGQPRVGNGVFANYLDGISGGSDTEAGVYHRVTHANDPIPKLPPRLGALAYTHSRTEYWESRVAMDNAETTYRCYGQEPTDCNQGDHSLDSIDKVHIMYAGMNATCKNP